MKENKIKMKTEESLEKIRAVNQRKQRECISFSNYRRRNKIITPTRFADIAINRHIKQCDSFSTNDQYSIRPPNSSISQSELHQAIDILKEISSKQINKEKDQNCKITPFELDPNQQLFQSSLSFKGAGNKLNLLRRITQIQAQIAHFNNTLRSINDDKNMNLSSVRLVSRESKETLRESWVQLDRHLQGITKMISEFVVEMNRCKEIMDKMSSGISQKTMNSYLSKFQLLIAQIEDNIGYLQNYISLLSKIHKNEPLLKFKLKHPRLIHHQYPA